MPRRRKHPMLTAHTRRLLNVISVKNVIIRKNVVIWGKYHHREKRRKIHGSQSVIHPHLYGCCIFD